MIQWKDWLWVNKKYMKKILVYTLILASIFTVAFCNKKSSKGFKFGLNVASKDVDTNKDGKSDTMGYFMDDAGNYRLLYNELDRNLDGFSDLMIWVGSSTAPKKEAQVKDIVKIHEEEDEDYDGKLDVLRWYLPNEFIALTQHDKDKDGYFETTTYYNFKKLPVRSEIDTNFDGRADRFIWDTKAELDTDYDGIPDSFTEAPTRLILEDKVQRKVDIKPLDKTKSWFLNPSLAPAEFRSIIGSGYF